MFTYRRYTIITWLPSIIIETIYYRTERWPSSSTIISQLSRIKWTLIAEMPIAPDNFKSSLGQHSRDVHRKTKLVKGQKTLSFSSFSGSKCKKSRHDNYDDSEETQIDIDYATQELSSVSDELSGKRPEEENVTAVCSTSYVTTNDC